MKVAFKYVKSFHIGKGFDLACLAPKSLIQDQVVDDINGWIWVQTKELF